MGSPESETEVLVRSLLCTVCCDSSTLEERSMGGTENVERIYGTNAAHPEALQR